MDGSELIAIGNTPHTAAMYLCLALVLLDKFALGWETQGGAIKIILLVKWVISIFLAVKLKKNLTISPNQL